MSANVQPVFPKTPNLGWTTVAAANTANTGTGTVNPVFTAGADGSRVDRLIVCPTGASAQTVLRVFANNGGTNTISTNNILVREATIPASTLSQTDAAERTEIPLDMALPAGYTLFVTIGTAVATALAVACEGGDF